VVVWSGHDVSVGIRSDWTRPDFSKMDPKMDVFQILSPWEIVVTGDVIDILRKFQMKSCEIVQLTGP